MMIKDNIRLLLWIALLATGIYIADFLYFKLETVPQGTYPWLGGVWFPNFHEATERRRHMLKMIYNWGVDDSKVHIIEPRMQSQIKSEYDNSPGLNKTKCGYSIHSGNDVDIQTL